MNETIEEIHEELIIERCEAMLKDHTEMVLRKVRQKINSGALEGCSFRTRTALAKVVLTSALRDCTDLFAPQNGMYAEDLSNLDKV